MNRSAAITKMLPARICGTSSVPNQEAAFYWERGRPVRTEIESAKESVRTVFHPFSIRHGSTALRTEPSALPASTRITFRNSLHSICRIFDS